MQPRRPTPDPNQQRQQAEHQERSPDERAAQRERRGGGQRTGRAAVVRSVGVRRGGVGRRRGRRTPTAGSGTPRATRSAAAGWWARGSTTGVGDDDDGMMVGGGGGGATDSVGLLSSVCGGFCVWVGVSVGVGGSSLTLLVTTNPRASRLATTTTSGETARSAHERNGAGGRSSRSVTVHDGARRGSGRTRPAGVSAGAHLPRVVGRRDVDAVQVALRSGPRRTRSWSTTSSGSTTTTSSGQRGQVHRVGGTAQLRVGQERVGVQLARAGVHQVAGRPGSGRWCPAREIVVVLGAVGTSSEPGSWARPPTSTVVAVGAFQSRWVARPAK